MTQENRPVTVVVVAYGSEDLLGTCLAPVASAYRTIVVDNASRPECREVSAEHGAEYVDAGRNGGFAAGVNIGVDLVEDDSDVLLLNPDAQLTAADLTALRDALRAAPPDVCAVAPSQRDPESGHPQRVAWPFPTPGRQWLIAFGLGRWLRRSEFLIGSALLLRRQALRDVGPLDESYFLYCEETDWQRRAALLGWRTLLVPEIEIFHVGGGTSSDTDRQQAYFHAGNEIYIRKWFGPRGWRSYRLAALVGAGLRAVVLRGERRQETLNRFAIYREGPVRHRARYLPGNEHG